MSGAVITFYSYKGGVGRTLALANVGALFSLWGYKVLCVDWDLEAPGLHLYFNRWIQGSPAPGLVELVESCAANHDVDWHDHVTSVKLPDASGRLDFIAAGRFDESYVRRMQELDWEGLYSKHCLGEWIESLRNQWKEAYDFILLDSRTGVTDIGGICTIQMPDQLVLLFTANHQSLRGVIDVAGRAAEQRNRLPFDRASVPCVPVPTRFEGRVQLELAKEWLDIFAERLAPFYQQWLDVSVEPRQLLDLIRVPYVAYWSFGENLPVIDEGTRDPESIGFALETLAALLAKNLADTNMLIRNRDDFVTTARRSIPQNFVYDVFMIYKHTNFDLAKAVAEKLKRSGITVFFGPKLANTDGEAMDKSRNFVVIIGRDGLSASQKSEVDRAFQLAFQDLRQLRYIIPVLAPGAKMEDIPHYLRVFQAGSTMELDRVAGLLASHDQ